MTRHLFSVPVRTAPATTEATGTPAPTTAAREAAGNSPQGAGAGATPDPLPGPAGAAPATTQHRPARVGFVAHNSGDTFHHWCSCDTYLGVAHGHNDAQTQLDQHRQTLT